jgi:hypothetical protein
VRSSAPTFMESNATIIAPNDSALAQTDFVDVFDVTYC